MTNFHNSKIPPHRLQVASLGSAFIAAVAVATASEGSSKRTVVSCNVSPHSSQIQINRSCSFAWRVRSTTKVHEPSARRGEWGMLAGRRNKSPAFKTSELRFTILPKIMEIEFAFELVEDLISRVDVKIFAPVGTSGNKSNEVRIFPNDSALSPVAAVLIDPLLKTEAFEMREHNTSLLVKVSIGSPQNSNQPNYYLTSFFCLVHEQKSKSISM